MKKLIGFLMLTILAAASSALAVVDLRYSPLDSTMGLGETARISIMIDEPLDLRTIEVFVDFDPAVLATLSGGPGSLFTDEGFNLFQGFVETAPGSWHGYCVVMGAGDFITGPGELFYWEVEALAEGVSPITTVNVGLAAPDATVLPDVTLPSTTLTVSDITSPVDDLPTAQTNLDIFPNPFNPRAEVRFDLAADSQARLDVLDSRGHRVAVLHDGPLSAGTSTFTWNGRGDNGLPLSAGLYFFRLETPRGVTLQKGMLVK